MQNTVVAHFRDGARREFEDGETLVGYCQGYSPNRPGFFLFPADPGSNNDRIFVVTAATLSAAFI